MFDKLLEKLEQNTTAEIPVLTDDMGYYDRECPSESCMFKFKIFGEDWTVKCQNKSVFCPQCGNNESDDEFWTTEQIENSEKNALKYVEGLIAEGLSESAKDFNSKQPKDDFLTKKMEYQGSVSKSFIIPIPALKELEQKLICSQCNSKYSILGTAYFCPCCGHNSVIETFDNSIKKITNNVKNLNEIRVAISKVDADEAENTVRTLIESGLSDAIMAFQRYCEVSFKNLAPEKKIKFNAFQNLIIGASYWKELFNETYINWLSDTEYKNLNILFQKRHLLSHCEGIVDEKYISKSGDIVYKEGQRIVVKEADVLELVKLIKKLINKIKNRTIPIL